MSTSIADIRINYSKQSLSEKDVSPDAMKQFDTWWNEAVNSKLDEVNAMTLATASADGLPSARIVLLKGFTSEGFVFFTNYNSYKGKQLIENPRASLVFFWKELERQVRITGLVEKVSSAESSEYFHSRPTGSQIGASISPQSEVVPDREWLAEEYNKMEQAVKQTGSIERPAHWGGFRVKPVVIEFWQGRPSRLHDRLEYNLQADGSWTMQRLAP